MLPGSWFTLACVLEKLFSKSGSCFTLTFMGTLSEIYGSEPVTLNYLAPLDFGSVSEVPVSHTWPEFHLDGSALDVGQVPIIDLSDSNAVKLVGEACEKWGIFLITDHGVPARLLEEFETECWRLFTLPTQHKLKALRSPDEVTGYGLPQVSSSFHKIMWHEGFTVVGSPKNHARQLWPQNYAHFCYVIEEYQKEMKKLAERLMSVMLEALGISAEYGKWANPTAALQLNSYPACPEPDRTVGLVPHTDTSLFTVVFQSSTGGLQILGDGVGWVNMPGKAGALIVNVSDLLHIISNARFKAVFHRAVVQKTHRLSAAYFYGPPMDAEISPSSKLVDENHAPRYRSMTNREYLSIKSKHPDALSLIRL